MTAEVMMKLESLNYTENLGSLQRVHNSSSCKKHVLLFPFCFVYEH